VTIFFFPSLLFSAAKRILIFQRNNDTKYWRHQVIENVGAVYKQKVSVSAQYLMLSTTADRISIFKKQRDGSWPRGTYRLLGDRDEANAKTATTSKEMASWSASTNHGGIYSPFNGISRCFSAFAHTDNYL
jgi:hypothetical protein